jgi:phage I-like protein
MKLLTVALELKEGQAGKEPPKEFRIFGFGVVETSRGPLLFDQEAAALVMAAFRDQANELSIDYEHQALENPPVKAPAAGWFSLELREDGLWATNVRWTPQADAHLRAGEYRYFSPAVELDPSSGRVLRLINLALTNLPATKAQKPLVAASDKPTPNEKEITVMKSLLAAMGLKDTANEAEALSAFNQFSSRYQQQEQELLQLTSTKSVSEAFGAIRGLKESAAQVEKLSGQLKELQAKDLEREVSSLIEQGKRDGKLAPAQEHYFRELGQKDVALLRGFLATAPKLVVTPSDAARPPPGEPEQLVLNETEKRTAKQLGISEAEYLATKKSRQPNQNS